MVDQVPSWATAPQEEAPSWAAEPPSAMMDIAHTAGPSLVRGGVAAATAIPSILDLGASGLDWFANTGAGKAVLPESVSGENAHKLAESAHSFLEPATYTGAMKRVEDHTGPLYQAQTTPGKYAQSALEFLPSAVYGGVGGLGTRAMMALFGGLGSQAGGDVAKAVGLPETAGRVVGGLGAGIVGPKLVAPATVSPSAAANAKTLEDAGVKLTAGQATRSPWMLQREANLMTPARAQNEAGSFTQAAAGQAGMPGASVLDRNAFQTGQANMKAGENLVTANEIRPPGFASLKSDLNDIRRQSFRDIGQNDKIDSLIDKVAQGPTAGAGPQPLSMTGGRYQALRQEMQTAIDNAATPKEAQYISSMRKALDDAMGNEFAPGELQGIHQTTSNFHTLRGAKLPEGQLTPEGLHAAISKKMGEEFYNQGHGMSPLAQAGETALGRPPQTEPGSLIRSIGAGLGFLGGKAAAPGEGFVGSILGRELAPDLVRLFTRNPITRGVYFNPVTQSYLRNGVPGLNKLVPSAKAINPALAVRLLSAPEYATAPTRVQIDVPKR